MQATAENLRGRRGDNVVFSDVGFVLVPGEALVVTGPNGAGKSTLLRVLAGLLGADAGRFSLADAGGGSLPVSDNAHYLGHANAMKRELTVTENLLFWQSFLTGDGDPGVSVDEAIEAVGLTGVGHLPFGYLSAGQQRRIALARLLVARRPLWLLDEPTAALDARADIMFASLMTAHLQAGGMAIAATHQPLGLTSVKTLELDGVRHADDSDPGAWGDPEARR